MSTKKSSSTTKRLDELMSGGSRKENFAAQELQPMGLGYNLPSINMNYGRQQVHDIWGKMQGTQGKRDGADIVQRVEQAFEDANLSDDEYKIVIESWKMWPWGTGQEILEIQKRNMEKRDFKFKGYDFSNSSPTINQNALLDKFIDVSEKVRRHIGNPNELHWGSVGQLSIFKDFIETLSEDVVVAIPRIRKMIMKRFTYNTVAFEITSKMVLNRWSAGLRAIAQALPGGTARKVGDTLPGSDKKLTTACYSFEKLDLSKFGEIIKYEHNAETKLDKVVRTQDVTFGILLQVANFPDVRLLLQSSEVRQAQTADEYGAYAIQVANLMLSVINSIKGNIKFPLIVDKDSDFSQEYYRCHGILKATLRNLTRRVFGTSGGPNTRTRQNAVLPNGKIFSELPQLNMPF